MIVIINKDFRSSKVAQGTQEQERQVGATIRTSCLLESTKRVGWEDFWVESGERVVDRLISKGIRSNKGPGMAGSLDMASRATDKVDMDSLVMARRVLMVEQAILSKGIRLSRGMGGIRNSLGMVVAEGTCSSSRRDSIMVWALRVELRWGWEAGCWVGCCWLMLLMGVETVEGETTAAEETAEETAEGAETEVDCGSPTVLSSWSW